MATASPARSESSSYVAWGHSSAVSPWGEVIASTDEKEGIVYADIDTVIFQLKIDAYYMNWQCVRRLDLSFLDQIRDQIPITRQRRSDVYEVIQKNH